MFFDWSLAQNEWSDEQKIVWQQAKSTWDKITGSQWEDIEQSEEWENFANDAIKSTFKKNKFKDDIVKIKAWRLINLLMIIYPSSDVYIHNPQNGNPHILFGRKDSTQRGEPWLFLGNSSRFLRLEICIEISQMRDAKKADMPHVQLDNEDINIIKDNIAKFLQKTNPDGMSYAEGLKKVIKGFEGREKRLLPIDYSYNEAHEKNNEDTEASNYSTTLPQYPLNVIFYGPPGTGKTYTTIERAMRICKGEKFNEHLSREELVDQYQEYIDDERIVFTTFHQSYSYEDFIEGIRATTVESSITYNVQDGVFKELCENAYDYPDEKFVIVIDEINRGNISRIFGELITLIEDSKRKGELEAISVKLPYSRDSFSVPQNVYIIGTMNTADRSLAGLDLALRRRFDFKEMMPDVTTLEGINVSNIKIDKLLTVINQRIEVLLDREHTIGHAYFIGLKSESSISDLASIFKNKVIPLLQEYFYEDWEKINMVLGGNDFITKKPINSNLFSKSQNDAMQLNSKTIWSISGDNVFENAEQYIRIYAPQNNGT